MNTPTVTISNLTLSTRNNCRSQLNLNECGLCAQEVTVNNEEQPYNIKSNNYWYNTATTIKKPLEIRHIQGISFFDCTWKGEKLHITKDNLDKVPEELKPFIHEDVFNKISYNKISISGDLNIDTMIIGNGNFNSNDFKF